MEFFKVNKYQFEESSEMVGCFAGHMNDLENFFLDNEIMEN